MFILLQSLYMDVIYLSFYSDCRFALALAGRSPYLAARYVYPSGNCETAAFDDEVMQRVDSFHVLLLHKSLHPSRALSEHIIVFD
jgi:hypothetical protein